MNGLGNTLYEHRKRLGLSQEELAEKLGVSRQAISKWERDEAMPDTENLIALSALFSVSLDELVGNTPKGTAQPTEEKAVLESRQEEDSENEEEGERQQGRMKTLFATVCPIATVIAFLLWGFFGNGWHIAWTLFLLIPVITSIAECVEKKRISTFGYPVLAAFLYLLGGMAWNWWHPHWIIFVTIPAFYAIAEAIDKRK